ncbi:MAG: hypothetical protein JRH05_03120 [Deltaproteobacteria bacterium]|nr:hypothetical protein [Deltaproteobacteria bacterium]
MLAYMLGRRPDEFGLAPAPDGFVGMKELLQALHEEPEWRFVRQAHIREILVSPHREAFETRGNRIRVHDRSWYVDSCLPAADLPAILFSPVRRKAHHSAMEKGLRATGDRPLVLTTDRDTALRIGRRKDPRPVILEVRTVDMERHGVTFQGLGELILSEFIPPELIMGPPVSVEQKERRAAQDAPPRPKAPPRSAAMAGTFLLDERRDPDPARRVRGKKARGWKEASRKIRKRKQ